MYENIKGQASVKRELVAITSSIKNNFRPLNILLRASPGQGKTFIATELLRELFFRDYSVHDPGDVKYNYSTMRRVAHFFDECHLISDFESLYKIMDSGKCFCVFASNISGNMPFAFVSRCIVLDLAPYTEDDIVDMLMDYSVELEFAITKATARIFAGVCRLNPRVAKGYLLRTSFLINHGDHPLTISGIKSALKDISVYDGGFTDIDIRYIQFLKTVGNSASLRTISSGIGVDQDTLINFVEPFLISKGILKITNRRTLVSN